MILHDPQTTGPAPLRRSGARVLWRCQIGNDVPSEESDTGALDGLLSDPERSLRLGAAAHEYVCEHSLGPRQLLQYADLIERLDAAS